MPVCLPDVNVLIALIDPNHVHHNLAHEWFESAQTHRWATCAITENGVVRIVSGPRYPNPAPSLAIAIETLLSATNHATHEFWPDEISLLDPAQFDRSRLHTSGQITDSYLLALAKHHGGKLVTLDRRLVTDAVPGGLDHLELLG